MHLERTCLELWMSGCKIGLGCRYLNVGHISFPHLFCNLSQMVHIWITALLNVFFLLISGGTLKIYGESLRPDVPYKTLLLSTADTAAVVIKEALEKYGLEQEDPELYCLVEVCPGRYFSHLLCGVVSSQNISEVF